MIARVTSWKELERWIPGGGASWEAAFPLVPIGDVMRIRRKVVLRQHFNEYQPITIHFDGSIDLRDRTQPFKSTMFAALPGDLVYSKIDVRNGAIGLLPPEIKQAVVTNEYPVLVPDSKQVEVGYLALLLRSPNFQHLLKQSASGTSGRKRVHGDSFSELEIPLPEPTEQRQLLSDYDNALGKSAKLDADALALEQRVIREFEAALGLVPPPDLPRKPFQIARYRKMERWTHEAVLQEELLDSNQPESAFDIVPLEDVAKVTYGIQKCPANRPGKQARPYLRVANVQRNYLDLSEIKQINVPDAEMHKLALREGDLLLCEGNSPDLVGRGAIWREEIPGCVHQNHVLRVRVINRKRVMPEFILEYINSPQGQAYFRSKAKWTTNLASINSREVAAMPLPLPDTLKRQEAILSTVQRARDKAAAKRSEAERLRAQAWADFLGAIFN